MKKILAVLILMFIAWGVIAFVSDGMAVEPDAVYEMCNQHIEWHYAGK